VQDQESDIVLPQPRRRWALFPRSVISDHENPTAHLYRAMARHIVSINDEARFYEERANPWLRSMLVHQGASALRSFQDRFPEVDYVTYEPRTGHRLAEWLSLALATVDLVVVDPEAPPTIVQWIGELTRPHLHTFLLDPEGDLTRAEKVPEFVEFYRALCTSLPATESLELRADQYLITFGPGLPSPRQNGSAERHIDATAATLVERLADAVDGATVMLSGDDPQGGNAPSQESDQ
jgi:hypothetical protein